MTQTISQRNVYVWYTVSIFSMSVLVLPIWVLFATDELGLTNTQAFIIGVIPHGLSTIFEVPSGVWSDRYGPKIFRIGTFLFTLSIASYVITSDFWLLLIFQLLGSIGLAMQSGGPEGLVRNSIEEEVLDRVETDEVYASVHSRKQMFRFLSRVIVAIGGAYLYIFNPLAPFIVLTISNTMSLLASFAFIETQTERMTSTTNWRHFKDTLKTMTAFPYLRKFLLVVVLYVFFAEALFALYQPYFESIEIDVSNFGYFYAFISATAAIGAANARRLLAKFDALKIYAIMFASSFLAGGLLLFQMPLIAFFALPIASLAAGAYVTVTEVVVQGKVSSARQSTAVSITAFIRSITLLIAASLIGIALDMVSVRQINIFLATSTFVVFLIVITLARLSPLEKQNQ